MSRLSSRVRALTGMALSVCLFAMTGCANASHKAALTGGATTAVSGVSLPPAHGRFSYQIGGSYSPPAGVQIVDRDRSDRSAAGRYSICYVNAFQAQPEDATWWEQHHPGLLLRGSSGALIIDATWNEPLFDISTAAKRTALLSVAGGWIDGCASSGYRAVEADNLDSYTRSKGLLDVQDALAFASLLIGRAHHDQLAIAQKNGSDLTARAHRIGFDFAVTEECQVYSECDAYTAVYGRHVIEIEYTDNPRSAFTTACKLRGDAISVVLRDRDVAAAGAPHHVEQWCSG
jgi:hypothetical protein